MSKETFWVLIQEARTACGQDLDAMEDYLRERLVSMGPAAAKDFHDICKPMRIWRTNTACGTPPA